ncbi:divergent polysaccharide deacetylase family protein [Telmatospirillum sp. J64-1]|uniref:divergent polysaccharide deacetylase family protein n=1 Tax=Telmatospirillum sp. J64-1 TaxID=2502183 RepID=UPI00115F22CF|nr:divergent polysaccharide deacetylase family protein [Telmatospirillum sp. J64-1]
MATPKSTPGGRKRDVSSGRGFLRPVALGALALAGAGVLAYGSYHLTLGGFAAFSGSGSSSISISMPMPPRGGPEDIRTSLLTPPGAVAPRQDRLDERSLERRPWLNDEQAASAEPAPAEEPADGEILAEEAPGEEAEPSPPPVAEMALPPEAAPETPAPSTDTAAAPQAEEPSDAAEAAAPAEAAQPPALSIVEPVVARLREDAEPPRFADLLDWGPTAPLPEGPHVAMLAASRYGQVPVIGREGHQSWQVYARPFAVEDPTPRVAVVMSDLGMRREATEAVIEKLPPEVTLSFSPYASMLDQWMRRARMAGHEVMLDLPMETPGFPARDPGPYALLSSLSTDRNRDRLEQVLSRGASYVGLNAPLVTRLADAPQMPEILGEVKERGLLWLGDLPADIPDSRRPALAPRPVLADEQPFADFIDARLALAEATARDTGRAVVVLRPTPVSLQRLLHWEATLKSRGVVLAPLSALAEPPPVPPTGAL